MARKLQFAFKCVASPSDRKANVIAITSITTEDNKKYMLPENEKFASNHNELTKTESYKRMKKCLNQRGRNSRNKHNRTHTEEKLPNRFKGIQLQNNGWRHLKKNVKDSKLKKITQNFEILRLFLDWGCLNWHSPTLTALTMEVGWNEWKQKFLKSFAGNRWSTSIYAISYRYKEGSLMEYAMRKEKLLLDMDNNIDFCELNKIVTPQVQPFSLIEDLILKTRNCKYFTSLDINSTFWSIPLRIEDRQITGFVTQEGHFQQTCLPFGLKTSSAFFQRILSNILRKNKLKDFSENYIDDILIFSISFEEHIEHIERVIKANEGFRLKFKKCTFATESVKYLGYIIEHNTVRPVKDNLISIQNSPIPKTQKNIRQFLGKINFYHEYISKSSILLDPLHKLLRKNEKFIWSEEREKSFTNIKKLLCSQLVLQIFDKNLSIRIYTDTSLEGIDAIFKQIQSDGKEKPVTYFSKKLNDSQKRKEAIYVECLAIKEAVKYWQHWLIGRKFTIFTDHKSLEGMNIKARTDKELGQLTYYLSQYDFQIKYIPGKDNAEADSSICSSTITIRKYRRNTKNKLRLKLIKEIHSEWCHVGIKQMINRISPYYTDKDITANIKKICQSCEICIKNKSRGQGKYGLMSQLGPATKSFEIMSIDTIGSSGGQRSTKRYLHLLARYVFMVISKTQSATDFIKLINKVLETDKIGIILADQYPGINSREFKKFLKENETKLIFTAVNTPFSNGLNE
ncbi:uncharacterized protein LOC118445648 [Vespa mandarinia]|uniref:uncharacterized protein LOC118445648 n=1 Tax=Vespa mandarinia TaxID=7446 RepID=UPI00160F7D67|nr:uncharacterized protein LOC118445648 [Vespa mandarinia]